MHRLPAGTSFAAAALTEPLACALHGIEASEITAGDTVVILGSGPLGLLLTAIAKVRGAQVIVTGRGEERLRLARHFGADVVIDVSNMSLPEQGEAVREYTEQRRGADVAIEAIGTPETWSLAASLTRPGGLVNFFGGCASDTPSALLRVDHERCLSLHADPLLPGPRTHHLPSGGCRGIDYRLSAAGING